MYYITYRKYESENDFNVFSIHDWFYSRVLLLAFVPKSCFMNLNE